MAKRTQSGSAPEYQEQSADHMTNIVINQQQARQSQALPALASFFWPGLGQIIQGRTIVGLAWMGAAFVSGLLILAVVGIFLLPIVWLGSIIEAAKYDPR